MRHKLFLLTSLAVTFLNAQLAAHCQMPCGIYHDEMVYDQIDQYVETMYKGITVLNQNKFQTVQDKNEFVRWVLSKDNQSDALSELILNYFLMQKIKPDEPDTAKRLASAHRLLFLIVNIKQHADVKFVNEFADEWEKFKLMFHVEKYECMVDVIKRRRLEQMQESEEKEAKDKKEEPKQPEKK